MSLQKISSLLQNGDIININLISEELKKTLSEICTILSDQANQINELKLEMTQKVSGIELIRTKTAFDEKLNSVHEQINSLENKQINQNHDVVSQIEKTQEDLEKVIDEMKNKIIEENEARDKEVAGDFFIANQQIREINVKLIGHQNMIQKSQTEISKINRMIDSGKDKSVELLAVRLEAAEGKIQNLSTDAIQLQGKLSTQIDELKQETAVIKKDAGIELHALRVELKDVRHMIVDAPAIDIDGVMDTPALIRAIQRDSRRIDTFNETINAVRDEHIELRSMFRDLAKGFGDFQINMHDFVEDHNKVKSELYEKVLENAAATTEVSKDLIKVNENVQTTVDFALNGLTQVSNTFLQLVSFLTKLSSRPIPSIGNFDEVLLEMQQFSDGFNAVNEKLEEKAKRNDGIKTFNFNAHNPFKLGFVAVPIPSGQSSVRTSIFDSPQDATMTIPSKTMTTTSASPIIDMELRHNVQEMKGQFEAAMQSVGALKEGLAGQLERKADTQTVERLLEKMRMSVAKVRDSVNQVMKTLAICVRRDELDKLVATASQNAEQTNSDLVVFRPKTTLSNGTVPSARPAETLPRLSRLGMDAHKAIYGTARSQRQGVVFDDRF